MAATMQWRIEWLDPHSPPPESKCCNHLIYELIIRSQFAVGSDPPEQLRRLNTARCLAHRD